MPRCLVHLWGVPADIAVGGKGRNEGTRMAVNVLQRCRPVGGEAC
jgi:hypothetical protein